MNLEEIKREYRGIKIDIPPFEGSTPIGSGRQTDIAESWRKYHEAIGLWRKKIAASLDKPSQRVIDLLCGYHTFETSILINKEKEVRLIELKELKESLEQGWKIVDHPHSWRKHPMSSKTQVEIALMPRKSPEPKVLTPEEYKKVRHNMARFNAGLPPIGVEMKPSEFYRWVAMNPARCYW